MSSNPYEQEKRRLEEELNRAVEVENYEDAAKIRDKLREIIRNIFHRVLKKAE